MQQKDPLDDPYSKNDIPTSNKLTFGDVLRHERKNANLSQQQLANKLNVSKEAVAGWEKNHHTPRSETLTELYRRFPNLKQALPPTAPKEGNKTAPDTDPALPHIAQNTPAAGTPLIARPQRGASRSKQSLIVASALLVVIAGMLVYLSGPSIIRYIHHGLETPIPSGTPAMTTNTTPAQLAQLSPTIIDTLSSAGFLHWTIPQGNANIRACQFTPTGLDAIDRSYWPLALCFEQKMTLATPYAMQADLIFPSNGNNLQPHGAGMIIAATQPSDNTIMYRIRIGSDGTYDIYVTTSDQTHQGRLNPCPNLTDATAQSTLHNDYNDPTSPYIHQGLGQTNTVTVTVVGHFITLYVNGHKLETACDITPTTGLFGLFSASPFKNEVTTALFTNLKIWGF